MEYIVGTVIDVNHLAITVLGNNGNVYRTELKRFKFIKPEQYQPGMLVWVIFKSKGFNDIEVSMILPWSEDETNIMSILRCGSTKS